MRSAPPALPASTYGAPMRLCVFPLASSLHQSTSVLSNSVPPRAVGRGLRAGDEAGELLRVPGVDLGQLVDRAGVGVGPVRQIVVALGDVQPGEPRLRHRARPLQRRHAGDVAGERHRQEVHLQRAHRREGVVRAAPTRPRRSDRGRTGCSTTRSVVRRVSISRTAVQVRVEALPVGAAEAAGEARELRRRRRRGSTCRRLRSRASTAGSVCRSEKTRAVDAGRIVVGRQRLVGGAVDHPPPVVGGADLDAELERSVAGSAPPALGDALIDGRAHRPARGRRAHAGERTGVQQLAGQHPADAVLVAVAAAALLLEAADHDDVALVRLERRRGSATA